MRTRVSSLKAQHGDCFIVETFDGNGNEFNILIDGGTYKTFRYHLARRLIELKVIHLIVLTHIDDDHIAGLIAFVKSELFLSITIRHVWLNCAGLIPLRDDSTSISYRQGIELQNLLIHKGIEFEMIDTFVYAGKHVSFGLNLEIDVLSPTKETLDELYRRWPDLDIIEDSVSEETEISDGASSQIERGALADLAKETFKPQASISSDLFNSSIIAFLLRTPDFNGLFLADSRSEIIESSLKNMGYGDKDTLLKLDFAKISHHGSLNNTACSLLDIIQPEKFLIYTNGGRAASRHPDRNTIASILEYSIIQSVIWLAKGWCLNYPLNDIEVKAVRFVTEDELVEANCVIIDDITEIGEHDKL